MDYIVIYNWRVFVVNNRRIHELDSLRGIFAIIVAVFHFQAPNHFFNGSLAVDFFFILSGLVLSQAYMNGNNQYTLMDFFKIRVARLYPLHVYNLLVIIGLYIIYIFCFNYGRAPSLFSAIQWQFPESYYRDGVVFSLLQSFLLLNCIGFNPHHVYWNGPSWSVSVELWSNLIIFSYIKKIRVATMIYISLFMYVLIYNYYGMLGVHYENMFYMLNSGLVRGLAGILLGIVIQKTVKREFVEAPIYITIMQYMSFIFILFIMHSYGDSNMTFVAIPFAVFIIASLYRGVKNSFQRILSHKILWFLGEISYSIYLGHYTIQYIVQNFFNIYYSGFYSLVLYISIVIFYACVIHYVIEVPWNARCKNMMQNFLNKNIVT
ncbi:acyltransferase [Acetobacter okinawensis]|uniref:acyltransferase family protein n=1 Tax=Acetobacter okinawensis TaxID=1076594 RepID=UPI001BA77CBF|nr:acyltransferase [Acetobacter okinawensis]MBS0965095.1 acyltransferase [Acetobacter okinawensis]